MRISSKSLIVKEMQLSDVQIRIDYFHNASDDHLKTIGVDRALLPTREEWHLQYEEDYARPIKERVNYSLLWELDGEAIGFSSAGKIIFGQEAYMHLHLINPPQRRSGLGAEFLKESIKMYFQALELQYLFCEPNAFNIAPNRTLQKAGFHYLFTHETTPGPLNFHQAVTRWVFPKN